jgi:hypothetical protein
MFRDSITVSCLVFFNLINLFFKILTYRSSANFSGWFRLKGKSLKTFDIIVSRKYFFKFRFWGVRRAAARQPPPLGGALLLKATGWFLRNVDSHSLKRHSVITQEIWPFSNTAMITPMLCKWHKVFTWRWCRPICSRVLWCLVPLLIPEHWPRVRNQSRAQHGLYARSFINWVYECWNIQQRDTGSFKLVRWLFSLQGSPQM